MRFSGLLACALVLLIPSGCADFVRGEYWPSDDEGGSETGSGAAQGYAAGIHPLLDAGCARCHAPGNSADNTAYILRSDDVMASYATALEFVDLDSPADSRLLSKTAGDGHGGGTIFDDRSAEYELILAWIEQGAPP
jgi:hypothetical protein